MESTLVNSSMDRWKTQMVPLNGLMEKSIKEDFKTDPSMATAH